MQREEPRDELPRRASIMLESLSSTAKRFWIVIWEILGLKLGLRMGGQNAEYRRRRNLPLSVETVLLTVYR